MVTDTMNWPTAVQNISSIGWGLIFVVRCGLEPQPTGLHRPFYPVKLSDNLLLTYPEQLRGVPLFVVRLKARIVQLANTCHLYTWTRSPLLLGVYFLHLHVFSLPGLLTLSISSTAINNVSTARGVNHRFVVVFPATAWPILTCTSSRKSYWPLSFHLRC